MQCSLRVSVCRVRSFGVGSRKEGGLRARKQTEQRGVSASVSYLWLPALRVSIGLGWVYKKAREAPWGRPPARRTRTCNKSRQSIPTPRNLKQSRELALAASTSKLEKAGPVRGATAGAGEGDEIGIDPPVPETPEQRNKFLVLRLYEAINARDHAAVQSLLTPDLEWWFHGPPKHQHMMRLLTGGTSGTGFRFVPRSVDALPGASSSSTVIAQGHEGRCYWVHAWTVGPDGLITQLREYFNTDLTVTRLAAVAATASAKCVWQSQRPDSATNSLPGLLLAL